MAQLAARARARATIAPAGAIEVAAAAIAAAAATIAAAVATIAAAGYSDGNLVPDFPDAKMTRTGSIWLGLGR